MNVFRILLAEIAFRKLNFVLSLFAIVVAVALFVAGPMLVEGYRQQTQSEVEKWQALVDESERGVNEIRAGMQKVEADTASQLAELGDTTRKVTLGLGFNLLIVHKDTNMADFWASDYAAIDMPQEYVDRLAADTNLTLVTHIVATLQERIEWERRKVLLVGYSPEATQSHLRQKAPMGYVVKPGTVYLGHELAVDRKVGEKIEVPVVGSEKPKTFEVAMIIPEQGSKEDISIIMHLSDAQEVLNKPGKVNQIMAINCHCGEAEMPIIRQQLEKALPEARVTEFRTKFLARAGQRNAVAASSEKVLGQMRANLVEREKILEERKAILSEMAASRAQIERLMVMLSDVITPLVVLAAAIWSGCWRWRTSASAHRNRRLAGGCRARRRSSRCFWARRCCSGWPAGWSASGWGLCLARVGPRRRHRRRAIPPAGGPLPVHPARRALFCRPSPATRRRSRPCSRPGGRAAGAVGPPGNDGFRFSPPPPFGVRQFIVALAPVRLGNDLLLVG